MNKRFEPIKLNYRGSVAIPTRDTRPQSPCRHMRTPVKIPRNRVTADTARNVRMNHWHDHCALIATYTQYIQDIPVITVIPLQKYAISQRYTILSRRPNMPHTSSIRYTFAGQPGRMNQRQSMRSRGQNYTCIKVCLGCWNQV